MSVYESGFCFYSLMKDNYLFNKTLFLDDECQQMRVLAEPG